jgi:hypothetical protein
MSLDLTKYPSNGDDIPDTWIWWECSFCGDYAYIDPDWDKPKCSCNETCKTETTVEKDTKVIMLTIREYETLIKQCCSDIAVKAAEAREHGIDYQERKLLEIIEITKRAQELITISKEVK